ncbi:MAG: porin family protein [Hydrotalea flava]|uniref:type IX secretion system protein PorG n=2 Tax=Hydrotalea TaxID=1004300 RepID=UPI001C44E94D|nr:DUF6089 family protein [Hydrotalea lipotrueae]MBY0347665.1 porin family protein [Hydrotalea flava]
MIRKYWLLFTLCLVSNLPLHAQMYDSFVHDGEFGASLGLGHYFGDLNPTGKLNKPKFSGGLFYRKQINNYVGIRLSGNYLFLGYSDKYSDNPFQRRRNLSFNTDIWEMAISGDFNFFKFLPGFPEYRFTPYVSLGIGIFSYNPYTYLNGTKVYLRPLGTEGQGSPLYPNRKQYGTTALCIPFGLGVKYALNEKMNLFAEVTYRFTNTDYIDDVSTTYAPDAYPAVGANGNPTTWFLLQDRSYETGTVIGIKGRQRGTSLKNDSYVSLQVGVSFNLQSYKCPSH